MKPKVLFACLTASCVLMIGACGQSKDEAPVNKMESNPTESSVSVFQKGKLLVGNSNFNGNVWLQSLISGKDSLDCTIGNVTFAPGIRNNWHSHPGGQILLCTSGTGYYQEKGKTAQLLHPGDVITIKPNVIHWHGATANSEFTHIAIGTQIHLGGAVWYEAVSDEEYSKLPQ